MSGYEAPTFYRYLSPRFDEARIDGCGDRPWVAPFAFFRSSDGFGEETWLPSIPETVLAIRLSGATVRHVGRRWAASRADANVALQLRATRNAFIADSAVSFAQLFLSDSLIDRAAEAQGLAPLSQRLRDDIVFPADHCLERRMRALAARACDPAMPPTALEAEGLTLLVLDRLLALHEAGRDRALRGGLAPWQLRRVVELLRDRLAEEVSLEELAALVSLSPFHFCRAFKQSTGVPPFAYQRQLRCDRARELLEVTRLSIADIALEVGYETSQSLGRMFQRELGCSPSEWRRTRRS